MLLRRWFLCFARNGCNPHLHIAVLCFIHTNKSSLTRKKFFSASNASLFLWSYNVSWQRKLLNMNDSILKSFHFLISLRFVWEQDHIEKLTPSWGICRSFFSRRRCCSGLWDAVSPGQPNELWGILISCLGDIRTRPVDPFSPSVKPLGCLNVTKADAWQTEFTCSHLHICLNAPMNSYITAPSHPHASRLVILMTLFWMG